MFIDRNGKLLGKVSIVDIVIVLVFLVAAGIFLAKSSPTKTVIPQAQEDELRVSFFTKEVADKFIKSIKIGDAVKEKKSNAVIGHITDLIVEDTMYYGFDTEGKAVASAKPNYKSITIVVSGKGKYSGNETYINGLDLFQGKELAITTGKMAFWSRTVELKRLQE